MVLLMGLMFISLFLSFSELMMSVEDAVIKTIISGEVPIAAASRNFQPYKTNCFGKLHN